MKQILKSRLCFALVLGFIVLSGTTIAEWDDSNPSETPSETPFETPSQTPYPTPEVTKAPDPDPTAQIEDEQQSDPDEPIVEEVEEETAEPSAEISLVEEPPDVARSVIVRRVIPDIVHDGDPFQIEATLVGFDGIEYGLLWQYNEGHGWQDLPDANGSTTVKLIADRDNVNYDWRILVTIDQAMIMETTSIE